MARPRPRPALARSTARTVATRQPAELAITDWRRDAIVVRLTEKLHTLVSNAARRSADDVVAIGLQLERIRKRLAHGQWRRWIEDNAGFGRSTATNYIELAAWSRRAPAEFARLRHLGPGKLYVIATAEPQRVRTLKPGKLVALGSGKRKRIEDMTTPELGEVVGGFKTPEAEDEVPIEKVVQGLKFKVAAMRAAAEVFVGRVDEVGVDVVRGVRDEVREVLQQLEEALRG